MDKILEALKELKKVPGPSVGEYWSEVNKISEKEQQAFLEEEKKLILPDEVLHRRFTI